MEPQNPENLIVIDNIIDQQKGEQCLGHKHI